MSDTKLLYDEESSEERMKAIGQNGNTGEHYADVNARWRYTTNATWKHTLTGTNTGDQSLGGTGHYATWTQTIAKADQRTMSQVMNESRIVSNTWNESVKKQQLPDARKHQIISFIKSGVRLFGYVLLPFDIVAATIVLFTSEIIGIIEELV